MAYQIMTLLYQIITMAFGLVSDLVWTRWVSQFTTWWHWNVGRGPTEPHWDVVQVFTNSSNRDVLPAFVFSSFHSLFGPSLQL
jgi:hypothetical protein